MELSKNSDMLNIEIKKLSVRVVALSILNIIVWLAGSVIFMFLEYDNPCDTSQKSCSKKSIWTLSNAILYTTTLSTTIGYGNITPSSPLVRLLSLVYAGVACPVFALLLGDISELIQGAAQRIFGIKKISVSLSMKGAVLFLIVYGLVGTVLVASLFSWNYQDSLYFIGSTITTIGFGDIVPEDSLLFLLLGIYFITGISVYGFFQETMMVGISSWLDCLCFKPTKMHSL